METGRNQDVPQTHRTGPERAGGGGISGRLSHTAVDFSVSLPPLFGPSPIHLIPVCFPLALAGNRLTD